MESHTSDRVRRRADDRCEYCGFGPDEEPSILFHVDHVLPRQHGGDDDPSNLALSCHFCNSYKGPNIAAVDPETREVVRLFNPRMDAWHEHFEHHGAIVLGSSPIGQATVRLLAMNHSNRVLTRSVILGSDEDF